MSTILGVLAAVYGGSVVIIAGGGLIWAVTSRLGGKPTDGLETD